MTEKDWYAVQQNNQPTKLSDGEAPVLELWGM